MSDERSKARAHVALMDRLRDAPLEFNNHVLGRVHPSVPSGHTPQQVEVLDSVLSNRKTVVPAGHGVGKSFLASGAAIHFAQTRPNSRVLLFGPTYDQLQEVLWAELSHAFNNSRYKLPGRLLGGASPRLLIAEKWGIWCSSVGGEGVSKAGRHAGEMLVICDEACAEGYDSLIEDLEGLNASNYLFIGNPLRSGRFRSLCDDADAGKPGVKKINISSLESPHAHLARSPVGLADKGYLDDMRSTYGEDSPQWRVRVLGQFCDEDTHLLIPLAWLDRCKTPPPNRDHGPRTLAVDLSAGTGRGDDTVIIVRDNDQILARKASKSWSYPNGVADQVALLRAEYSVDPSRVIYDAGNMGLGFGAILESKGIRGAYGFVGAAQGGKWATNFRGACALAFKDRLNPNLHTTPFYIPPDIMEVLRPQVAELRYEFAQGDKIKLECKDDMKKRLRRSPDDLDATLQSFSK